MTNTQKPKCREE